MAADVFISAAGRIPGDMVCGAYRSRVSNMLTMRSRDRLDHGRSFDLVNILSLLIGTYQLNN